MRWYESRSDDVACPTTPLRISNTSFAHRSYVVPLLAWLFFYILLCASPMLIAVFPFEFGPRLFSSLVIWSSLANGVMIFVGLGALKNHPYLTMMNGMAAYGVALLIMVIGANLFFGNMREGFEVSLFWRRRSGEAHVRSNWHDDIWSKSRFKTKDDEVSGEERSDEMRSLCLRDIDVRIHNSAAVFNVINIFFSATLCSSQIYHAWIRTTHPCYLPFDLVVVWVEDLVDKYSEVGEEQRPEWLDDDAFVKRIATIFRWWGDKQDMEKVDHALQKLCGGRSGVDLEVGRHGRLTFKKKRASTVTPVE